MTTKDETPGSRAGGPPKGSSTCFRQPRVSRRDDDLSSYLWNFQRAVLIDALLSATADHWERRARDFDTAISRDGDHPGRRSIVQRLEADMCNRARATACRNHAAFIRRYPELFFDDSAADVDLVLGEAA